MRFNLPRITPVVKWLLITNISVFLASVFIPALGAFLEEWFAVGAQSWLTKLQLWRVLSYQFLHDRRWIWHIFMNMIGLYFLGPPLERHWGSRKFLPFYLLCGAAGAIFYLILTTVRFLPAGSMIGASGAILGLLSACAILFPHFIIFVFVFPVPIRVAAIGFGLVYFLIVVTRDGSNVGGHAAHLAGMVAGAGYVLLGPRLGRYKLKVRAGSWEKKAEADRMLQIEVDRILAKVHDSGLHSLTSREKKTLKRATQEELRRSNVR
ncbi:MAG: rhomboid family intramembrane serine protease [Phycisphaerales bacterium]|nr:MAG: rhomboid family intramembrane serine protease [Phycisphaerales bacterium]